MTSSAKQTDPARGIVVRPRSVALLALVAGLLPIFDSNDWRLGAPVFFLATAWGALIWTGLAFWKAGATVAAEDPAGGDIGFKQPSRVGQLLVEKRALLKAIKEIEFDRAMGKMSAEDAKELTAAYRKQAIEVLKLLESDGDPSIDELIDREVRVRLKVDRATVNGKAGGGGKKATRKDETDPPEDDS